MALHLRQARVTDLPAIYRGEEHYIRTWEPAHEVAWRSQLERHLTSWVENFHNLTVAFIDNHFAGYSLWVPEYPYAELWTIHVDPDHQRIGVGTALLKKYAVDAERQGLSKLRLGVKPTNPARFMYQKAGFVCVGTGAHDYLTYERGVEDFST